MDRSSQPGTPLHMSMIEMKTTATFASVGMNMPGNGPQGPCGPMIKQLPLSMDSHPDVPDVYDNVPLNPNLSGPPPPGKLAFDPISSMVQMSQQLGGNGNSPNRLVANLPLVGGFIRLLIFFLSNSAISVVAGDMAVVAGQ